MMMELKRQRMRWMPRTLRASSKKTGTVEIRPWGLLKNPYFYLTVMLSVAKHLLLSVCS
jgi:hypothetical protein